MNINTEKKYSNIITKAVETLLKANPSYRGMCSLSILCVVKEHIKDSKEKHLEYRALNFLTQQLSNEGLEEINFDKKYINAEEFIELLKKGEDLTDIVVIEAVFLPEITFEKPVKLKNAIFESDFYCGNASFRGGFCWINASFRGKTDFPQVVAVQSFDVIF